MLVLMQAPDGGQMNVPEAKVAQYLADGWKEISRQTPVVPAPRDVELPAPVAVPSVPDPPKGKKGKP